MGCPATAPRAAAEHDATNFSRGRVNPSEPPFDRSARHHHVWVIDPVGQHGIFPALLLGWRRGPDGWLGHVAVLMPGTHGPILVPDRIPAGRLRAA